MTGHPPYHNYIRPDMIIAAQCKGDLPQREHYPELAGLEHDELWNLLARCWNKDPSSRPTIGEVILGVSTPQRERN